MVIHFTFYAVIQLVNRYLCSIGLYAFYIKVIGLIRSHYVHIPGTTPHQIRNAGYEPLVYISLIITDPFTAHGTVLEHTD